MFLEGGSQREKKSNLAFGAEHVLVVGLITGHLSPLVHSVGWTCLCLSTELSDAGHNTRYSQGLEWVKLGNSWQK